MDHTETKGPERLCTAARLLRPAPHNSTTQSHTRHTTSTWRGGAVVLTVNPSAPSTHLTEDRDKGPQAHMPAAMQIVPEAQPREKAPKKPKSGKERALTKRDKKKEKRQGKRAYAPTAGRSPSYKHPDPRIIELAKTKKNCRTHRGGRVSPQKISN